MARTRGCLGKVKAGGSPTAVGQVTSWELDESSEELDGSVMGACVTTKEAGAVESRVRLSVLWDAADGGQDLFIPGDSIAVELFPGGDEPGKIKLAGTVNILRRTRRGQLQGFVGADFEGVATALFTESTVPTPP